jgi:predicted esterase
LDDQPCIVSVRLKPAALDRLAQATKRRPFVERRAGFGLISIFLLQWSKKIGMGRKRFLLDFLSTSVAMSLLLSGSALAQELERGNLIKNVVCREDPGQSYALYLPTAFDPGKKWPILILFDPGARGSAGVESFRAAAETYGWILAGSNNSTNGPMKDSARAAWALWVDALKRLPFDERRVYASGFSGGARVASIFPQVINRAIAGIIGCGAGLSADIKPGDLKAAAYFGLTGLADFNYGEMKDLDLAFDPSGVSHRFLFFEGVHDWPDPALCARAVGWMEVVAMKHGLRPKDEKLAEAVVGRELEEARTLENAGRVGWAVDRLEAAGRLADGLAEIPGLAVRVEALRTGKAYRQFLTDEKKRDRREADFRSSLGRAFGMVDEDVMGGGAVPSVLKEMRVGFLKKDAKNEKTLEDRSLASRLLFEFSFAAQARATDLFGKGEMTRAAAYCDLAIAACEEGLFRERYLYFNRSRIAALTGDKKRALEFLSAAVDKGLSDIDLLENTKELDPIRNTDRFREILEKIRKSEKRN